jgi:hypothetical protein
MASEIIERDLYGKQVHMVHNPNARGRAPRYKVTKADGESKPKGVTTIMGKVLAKDLVGWAIEACTSYLKSKLPVITEEDLQIAAVEHERLRDAGGSTGTEAHALVENYLKGQPVSLAAASQEAQNAYKAFVEWFEQANAKVINVEEVIYSVQYGFAGTYDCMLEIDGQVYLCDLKTTNASRRAPNGVYAENFVQLGAYALAHEEQRTFEDTNGGTDLVPVAGLMVISAKKNGKLDIVTAADVGLTVEECGEMFRRIHDIYSFMEYTTKALGGK